MARAPRVVRGFLPPAAGQAGWQPAGLPVRLRQMKAPDPLDPLARQVDRALGELEVDRAAPVIVACSGGPDSTVLAHLAMALARAGRLGSVALVHVDHRLRPGSAEEGEHVARLAAAGGGAFVAVAVDVARRSGSLEADAREARYAALDRVADERGAAAILVGHTRRDQAETVLMRIARGTGVVGLAGIPPRRGRIVRPLLAVAHDEVLGYLARHRLAALDDPMNRDPRHLRARARHEWLPALRAANPRIDDALVELAATAAEAREAIDRAAAELDRRARAAGEAAGTTWHAALLAEAPPAVRARWLARAVHAAGGGSLSARHHEAAARLLAGPGRGSARLDLPGITLWREYDRVHLAVPGAIPGGAGGLAASGPDAPYEVRIWRPGDRMRPLRLRGRTRKLSDLFTDARIPRRLRPAARVVVRQSDGAIVWAEHVGPAFGARIEVTLTPEDPVATNKNR